MLTLQEALKIKNEEELQQQITWREAARANLVGSQYWLVLNLEVQQLQKQLQYLRWDKQTRSDG